MPTTAEHILDAAEAIVQVHGFNAFSYADVSKAVGITKASVHHHFSSKAELGRRLIIRYTKRFDDALAAIEQDAVSTRVALERYAAIYENVLCSGRMCLCGILAAEYATLPQEMQAEIRKFFAINERWLVALLARGTASGELRLVGTETEAAKYIASTLEGALLLARPEQDTTRFRAAAYQLIDHICPGKSPSRRPARSRPSKT